VLAAAGGPRKRRAVKVEGDTRVFAEGALPQAPGGGALTTYRELCGAPGCRAQVFGSCAMRSNHRCMAGPLVGGVPLMLCLHAAAPHEGHY
jgi:hypothetical protein